MAGTVGCPYWARSVATVRGSVAGRPLLLPSGQPRGQGLRLPGRGACTGRPPASDFGTVRSARTLSTGCGASDRVPLGAGRPRGGELPGWVGVDRRPWCLRAGRGVRLVGAVSICRDVIPAGGRMFHDLGFPPPQIRLFPHVGGPGRDLVQLWLGPRPCSPRSQAGSTISAECTVCGAGVPTLRNTFPSAGITSRQMGPESIQRAPRPTCGNTKPQAASAARPKPDRRPVTSRPGARQPLPRPPTKPDAPPIEARPAALFQDL